MKTQKTKPYVRGDYDIQSQQENSENSMDPGFLESLYFPSFYIPSISFYPDILYVSVQ